MIHGGWKAFVWWLLLGAACAPRASTIGPDPRKVAIPAGDTVGGSSRLPPVAPLRAPLSLRVVYPPPDGVVEVEDSSFLFGSAGTGDAEVTVNGHPVPVWPNGAWLAWIPFPRDSVTQFRIEGRTATDTVVLSHPVRRVLSDRGRVARGTLWVDSASCYPRGRVWLPADQYLSLGVRASEGAELRLRLTDGTTVPLVPQVSPEAVAGALPPGGFDHGAATLAGRPGRERYAGMIRGRRLGPDPGPILPVAGSGSPVAARSGDSSWATLEAISGRDTVLVRWPLQLALLDTVPVVAELDDDPSGSLGAGDGIITGRATPGGGYTWFFPSGTRAIASGRQNDDLRLRLGAEAEAWVPSTNARALRPGTPAPRAEVGSVALEPHVDRVTLRVPVGQRIPFQVTEDEESLTVRLFGAVADLDWMRYGKADSLVRFMSWAQAGPDQVTLTVDVARPVWGYRALWDGGDFLLEVRRPPAIDRHSPLRERLIAVDAGHPPAGATGPTGLREAEANLAVALRLRQLLENAGARVLMTRTTDSAVDLSSRVELAEQANADLLVSIHNNALPDGVNPFVNQGTSVFYFNPRSAALASAVQAALVRLLGLPDLGIARGDLALVRGTWMPSVLTEGLFIMLPEQEAALRTEEGQRRYAEGVFGGVRHYLSTMAAGP